MKGINIAIYFDPDLITACVNASEGSYVNKKFEYDDGVIEEIYQWLEEYDPNRTHICLIENESAELLADELVDNGYHVHQVTIHQLLTWFAAEPPKSPDGTPMRLMLRYMAEEHPREYESRTPQTEALMEMFDELDALEMVEDNEDEDNLPADLLRSMKKHKISASDAAQRLIPDVNERIREHLMQYPELMTPEILQDFFPELLEALERPKH
ncbi:hypothetical protein ACVWWU_004096 [Pantoea sp. PA1]|jgi:hypothetical protein|nr:MULTISPECIES: hypothetical protein [Pantoea]AER34150.1 hypothetical protein PAGR_g3661 [Pantoea ananatis PA13]AMB74467.1 hypothetical protein AW734_06910 [Pantoea ananatis]ARF48656.1 hypothetical protein DSJ_04350 [Pantoea stewartii subsp. stewartii DC283]ASN16676.1 hypothetical protein B7764_16320 [Pantoea ananatis]AVG75598.1 hypothetical protein B9Q16_06085 [Pantoea ananatis]